MEQNGFHRKLTAILSAEVALYSRLMQYDESASAISIVECDKFAEKVLFSAIPPDRSQCGSTF
jgi:hypothetical protein